MPGTDDYGQGVEIALLSEQPNANTLAAGIVNALAERSNMRFASASERDATITSPVEGMEAWLEDVGLKTLYDGSAWVVSASGTQAWTTIALPSGYAHNGNSNGNFQYRKVNFFGEDTLMFRGAVAVTYSGSTIPNGGIVTSSALPAEFRPSTLRTFNVPCSDLSSSRISLKVDLQTDGHLQIFGTGSGNTPPWIGFNGTFVSL